MTLDAWLISTKTTNARFAAALGTTGESIRRYRNGEREPDAAAMARIFELTGGDVTPNDWVGVGPRSDAASQRSDTGSTSCPAS